MSDNHLRLALLTVDQMSAADAAAITGGTPGAVLMENAGAAVAREISKRWSPVLTVVLCGPGNNGGDGFVVARLLQSSGLNVKLALLGDINQLSGDAAAMAAHWKGGIDPLTPEVLEGAELIVDAIFGAGLARPVDGLVADVIRAIDGSTAPCIAVDMPSGVDGDTGHVRGVAAQATLSVTFFRRKPGHLLEPGRSLAGDIVVADIGISGDVLEPLRPITWENHPDLWRDEFPWPASSGHKYDRGHAVAVSGDATSTGAARLAARAALRVGAGLVTLAAPTEAAKVAAAQLTAVMVQPFADEAEFEQIIKDPRKNAVLVGPGNGVGVPTQENVLKVLELEKRCVLDADALTSFEGACDDLCRAICSPVLCTPHEGEFNRLFGSGIREDGKLAAARNAAKLCGATILLKGSDTVIAAPDGRAAINTNAPPTLATAGSGDVLAGFALGLLAQGMEPFSAGCAAAWLHGESAHEFGPGLIAEDLSESLPLVLRRLSSLITP
jgi:NAD(P)H-hydrate epimerase